MQVKTKVVSVTQSGLGCASPPPHWAAQKVVSVLVDSGADIHAANGAGISPLAMADTREAGLLRVCDGAIRGGRRGRWSVA